MKVELVGGPLCGSVVDVTSLAHMIERQYTCTSGVFMVQYQRTGMRMQASRHVRYDYSGQHRSGASV